MSDYDEDRAAIVAGLKRWALGMYNTQTAVAFIAATNESLEGRPWVRRTKHSFTDEEMYYFDWERFDKYAGGMSGGEYATWSLVRSLHEGELNEHLWRMDPNRGEAFAKAIANCRENWPH